MTIKELPQNLRPREKIRNYGVASLSDSELLAILLGSGYKGKSSVEMANELLRETGGFNGLMRLSLTEIMKLKGIKLAKATLLLASMEIARRLNYETVLDKDVISDPSSIVEWLRSAYGYLEQEIFVVIFLDVKNRVLGYEELFRGSIDNVHVEAREIFKKAFKFNARKIIVSHNHPSGICEPSRADEKVTTELETAGSIMNIPLVDHVIVSNCGYYSFKEHGKL
ncbi:MAG: DNA repair protein RadC [Erysipelotrichaceae bacterium]|nr:DNA repair protein RadC [Erysipelotrichaceae bacterium]